MTNNSNLSKRAALRKQQELEVRRKRKARMLGVGLGVLSLVVVATIVVVLVNAIGNKIPEIDSTAEQLTPPNATEGHGNAFQQLIDEGKITLEVRTAYFIDDKFQQTPNKKSSERAALAAAAADAVGKYREYHQVVYENQPANEGEGYTDQQLRVDFAAKAGITGDDLTTFQKLYDTKAYAEFARQSYQALGEAGITGTPAYVVNGKKIHFENLTSNDPQTVLAAIQSTASGS